MGYVSRAVLLEFSARLTGMNVENSTCRVAMSL